MGRAKEEGLRRDELMQSAMAIAIRAGSISADCPHETPIDLLNPDPAFELAREEYAKGLHQEFDSQTELEEAMQDAFDSTGQECGACAKNAAE
jgi:hypothetical protein